MMNRVVLLVEDNPDDAELTLRALKKNNIHCEIVHVRDGAEALEYLFGTGKYAERNTKEQPQVILLDLKMPKIDGLEVLRRMRNDARTRHLPVVILTSSREEQDLIAAYEGNVNSFVCKPINFAEFAETVRLLGLYWLTVNEIPHPKAS